MKIATVHLLALCFFTLSGCSSSAPAPLAPTGVPLLEKEITVPADGEVVLTLQASAPGAAWNRSDAEAATVSIRVDGAYRSDVVLFRGGTPFPYETLVGRWSAGSHRVAVYREPGKSAPRAQEVRLEEITAQVYQSTDPLYQAMAHAPILYGRDDARSTDTPLWMYHEIARDAAGTTIQYTILFGNEDGGTAPDALMARWGRLTDIEWVYRVTLDAGGEITREEFQDAGHGTSPFRGTKDGLHPVLKDVTRNNLFADRGTSPFRFALAPAEAPPDASREETMDLHPWMYRVMAEEWEREKQPMTERNADPDSRAVSDPRNYLYVEFRTGGPSIPACDAKLALQAKLRGDDRWYSSDHGNDGLRIQSLGWRRGTIELPPGTTGGRIETLRVVAYPGAGMPPCALVLTDVRKAFLLDPDYAPGPSLVNWSGNRVLNPADAASASAVFPLPMDR